MSAQKAVVFRIRELVTEKGITINKLAAISDIPPSTLKNIMNGNSRNTGIVTIAKICDGLGVSLQEFISADVFSDLNNYLL